VTDLFGNPIPGAAVRSGGGPQSAVTGPAGEYKLQALPSGKLKVTASYRGFRVAEREVAPDCERGRNAPLDFGLVPLDLTDIRPFILSGEVRDAGGAPVASGSVLLENCFNPDVRAAASTSERGEFRLEVRQPGQYVLRVTKPGFEVYAQTLLVPAGVGLRQRQARVVLRPLSEAAPPK
jgi:hypothetical protein